MKSFSKVLSVLVLSLFCSFFVGMNVHADNTVGEIYNFDPVDGLDAGIQFYYTLTDYYFDVSSGSSFYSYPGLVYEPGYAPDYPSACTFSRVVADTIEGEVYHISGSVRMNSGSVSVDVISNTFWENQYGASSTVVGTASLNLVDMFYLWCRPSSSESAVLLGSYPADGASNDFDFDFISSGDDITLFFYLSASSDSYSEPLYVLDDFVFTRSFRWVVANGYRKYPFMWDSVIGNHFSIPVYIDGMTYEIKQEWTENDPYLEQMKQTNDLLTNFPGSADMDSSKGQLDTAISDYDQIEGSLFDSGQAAFDQFDPSSVLTFSAGIYAAIAALSNLMIQVISAMGEFSVIYTIGVTLVFIGMLIGLWRFFK